ncbi:MAG TPA: PEP-CTERM sorting domain-containing protein [Pyrinomonadaceae bacterium]|nr:PEP-CTERM sorting domain-containing protein [Pyrinomonadaceae bacterium]
MASLFKMTLMVAMLAVMAALGTAEAKADPVTFSTTGVFSVSGTNVVNFTNIQGTTTITFNGTTNPVNTPAGTSFGDIVVTTTVPANLLGPAIGGTFTLNIIQVSPAGAGSLVGTLDGTLGFNSGIATLTFSTTSISIGGFTYTLNPVYTIALPVTGVGGGANTGTTTIQGTVTGGAVPEPTSMVLLGTGLLGVGGAVRKRFQRS